MSNKMDTMLLKVRDFVWDSDEVDCGENCPLSDICCEAENRGLTYNFCSEYDDRFLNIVKEIGKDE